MISARGDWRLARPMLSSLLGKITARFASPAPAPAGSATLALLMTLLLFVVANAFRFPPAFLAQLDASTGVAARNTQYMDTLFQQITAQGNIMMRFRGFDYTHDEPQPKATFVYIRASYSAFPKRVYVADDATLIPQAYTGNPFPGFAPAVEWLDEHQITALITAQQNPDGSLRYLTLPRDKF